MASELPFRIRLNLPAQGAADPEAIVRKWNVSRGDSFDPMRCGLAKEHPEDQKDLKIRLGSPEDSPWICPCGDSDGLPNKFAPLAREVTYLVTGRTDVVFSLGRSKNAERGNASC